MPSPFHQKYSSQSNKVFTDNTVPAMPEAPKEADRRGSDASLSSSPPSSPHDPRRRSSGQRFGNLQNLKRPESEHHTNRRASLQDSYGKVGFLGGLWNTYTRGPAVPAAAAKEPRDTTTLRG